MNITKTEIREALKNARAHLSEIDDLAASLDGSNTGFETIEEEFGSDCLDKARRIYLEMLIDEFLVDSDEYGYLRITKELAKEMMHVCYGIHKDFPPENYKSIQERRAAFANAHPASFIKGSTDTDSIARNVRDRENIVIDRILAESIMEKLKRDGNCYGILFEVYRKLKDGDQDDFFERIWRTMGTDEAEPYELRDLIGGEIPQLEFPDNYLKVSGLQADDYRRLSTKNVRKSLIYKYPLKELCDDSLEETAIRDAEKIRDDAIRILTHDPVLSYYVILALCSVEKDPLLTLAGDDRDTYKAYPEILTGRGEVLSETYLWMGDYVDLMNQRTVFGFAADSWAELTDPNKGLNKLFIIHKYYAKYMRGFADFLRGMKFRGVRFGLPSRSYRIEPDLSPKPGFGYTEFRTHTTEDWLMFDYYNSKGIHAFSLGFRFDELKFAIFSPYAPFMD